MRRGLSSTIASVLAVATLGIPTLPITATGETEQIVINTAQDFVDVYLSYKTVTFVDMTEVDTYTLFTSVDESNYLSVLAAKNYYDSLSYDYKSMVDQSGLSVTVMKTDQEKANDLFLQQQIDALLAYDLIDLNTWVLTANDINTKILQEIEQQQLAQQESEQQVVEENVEETEEIVESEQDVQTEEVVLEQEVVEEAAFAQAQESVLEMNAAASIVLDKQDNEVANLLKESVLEASVEQVEVSESVTTDKQLTAQPATTRLNESSSSTTAQTFVSTYLTSSAGNIYTQANSTNYQYILNGLSAWNNLSTTDKEQVNSILQNKVGKTYQTLLQEAQTIKYGGSGGTYVNTGAETYTSLYAWMCGISAALFGLILSRKKEVSE